MATHEPKTGELSYTYIQMTDEQHEVMKELFKQSVETERSAIRMMEIARAQQKESWKQLDMMFPDGKGYHKQINHVKKKICLLDVELKED